MSFANLFKAGLSTVLRTTRAFNRPVHLQIEPTTSCNLKCKFCSRGKSIRSQKQLSLMQFKEIFDQIMPSKVSISGRGEPLLADDLCKMIAYAKTKESRTTITSNFTLGLGRAEELIDSGIDNIRISIDSPNADVYKRIRGADLHGDVLKGLRAIYRIKKMKRRNTPHMGFEVVLTKDNIDGCLGVIALAKECGVEKINFRPLDLIGVEDKKDELLFSATKERLVRLVRDIREQSRKEVVNANAEELSKNLSFLMAIYQGEENQEPDCLHPWLQVYINVDGEITPCDALNTNECVSMGNVFEKGFTHIWNSTNYRNLRTLTRGRKLPYKSCRRCPSKGLMWFLSKYNFLRL